jgi:hypothetical protein
MASIGVRASGNEFHYTIFEGTVENPIYRHHYKLTFPRAFETPQALAWLREQFLNVTREYQVRSVFVRTTEPMARATVRSLSERSRVEGVIIEASAAVGFRISHGPLATMSSLLETRSARNYMELDTFRGIDNWQSLNDKYKEATLAAVCALALLEE